MAEDSDAGFHGIDGGITTRMTPVSNGCRATHSSKASNMRPVASRGLIKAQLMQLPIQPAHSSRALPMPFLPDPVTHRHDRLPEPVLAPLLAICLRSLRPEPNTPNAVRRRSLYEKGQHTNQGQAERKSYLDELSVPSSK